MNKPWIKSAALGLLCLLLAPWLAAQPGPAPAPAVFTVPKEAAKANAPFLVDVTVGYANYQFYIKPECWYPVWILIDAPKADISGNINLRQPDNQLQVSLPFQVAKNSKKLYLAYYRFSAKARPILNTAIQAGRQGIDPINVPLQFAENDEQHILVLPEEKGGFNQLGRSGMDLSEKTSATQGAVRPNGSANRRQNYSPPSTSYGGTKVAYGELELLPEDAIALEGLDGMVISTSRVRSMTPRQWEALRAWVMRGGRLLVAGGKYQPFIEQSVLKGAFGLTLAPPSTVTAAALFGGNAIAPASGATSQTLLVSWPAGAGARRVLGDELHPLLVSKRVGRGWFHLCAAALDSGMMQLLEKRQSPDLLWPPLLERHADRTPLEYYASQAEPAIGHDLQRPFGFNLVGAGWVFSFLGCYILLALPLNWIVCSRIKRREWAWPVAIVLALGFAWYGYNNGLRSQSKVFQVNETTFLMQPAGAPTARGITFSSVFSPRRYSTNLLAASGVFPIQMNLAITNGYGQGNEDLYAGQPLAISFQPPAVLLGNFFFHPWSVRNLRSDFTVPMAGGVTLEAPFSLADRFKTLRGGRLANHSPWTFNKWWITDGVTFWTSRQSLATSTTVNLEGAVANPSDVMRSQQGNMTQAMESIIRSGIQSKIIDPAMRETLTSQNGRMAMENGGSYNVDLAWRATPPFSNTNQGFYFIGEVETSLSPMTASMPLERRRGVLYYEAALPPAAAPSATLPQPARWTMSLLDPEGTRQRIAMNSPYYSGEDAIFASETVAPGQFTIPAATTDLLLTPDQLPDLSGGDSLTFAFRLADPKGERLFQSKENRQRAFGKQPGNKPQQPVNYHFAGCPVQVYNLRLRQWEPARIQEDGRHTVAPLKDYLSPATGALTLRVDADPAKLLFSPPKESADRGLITGEKLWGDDINNYNYYSERNEHILSLRITNIDVTFRGAGTSTLERR